ncbi:hypothetical protein EBQ74_06285 [bacterium]|nr:hypothetical protein [bacterium]
MTELKANELELIKNFFAKEGSQKGTKPLKNGIEICIHIAGCSPITLTKNSGVVSLKEETPKSPDMTFWIGKKGVHELAALQTEDVGEIGVAIMKLMISQDPEVQLRSKVHIGTLQLITHGYLGVIPLGGSTVMKFLTSKGFSNIGKIKEAISQLRG